jgi:uncharacterized protein
MKKMILLVLSLMLAAGVLSACQPVPAANSAQIRSLSANGQGQVFLTPDIAYIFIGVHSQNQNVSDALKDNNGKAQAIADALKNQGIDPKDIQTSSFNVFPQQQYGPQGETTGELTYVVDNTVNVTVRDLTKLGQLLDTVIGSGANSINGIQFDVKDKQQALVQARQLAIDNAKKQADEIAKASGVQLGAVTNVSVSSNPTPVPLFEGKGVMNAAGSQVPVSSGQLSITVDASITYELR